MDTLLNMTNITDLQVLAQETDPKYNLAVAELTATVRTASDYVCVRQDIGGVMHSFYYTVIYTEGVGLSCRFHHMTMDA